MDQRTPFRQYQQPPIIVQPPPPPTPRKTFRWSLVWFPLAIFLAYLLFKAMAAVVGHLSWDDLLSQIGIANKDRFSAIASLLCVCLAIVALAKVLSWARRGK